MDSSYLLTYRTRAPHTLKPMCRRRAYGSKGRLPSDRLPKSTDASQLRSDVQELLRLTDNLLASQGLDAESATQDELSNAFRLSGDIALNLGKFVALAEKEGRAVARHPPPPEQSWQYPAPAQAHASSSAEQHLPSQMVCHQCDTVDTPKWRKGPGGHRTLCNVCGLLYAKRQQRQDRVR